MEDSQPNLFHLEDDDNDSDPTRTIEMSEDDDGADHEAYFHCRDGCDNETASITSMEML